MELFGLLANFIVSRESIVLLLFIVISYHFIVFLLRDLRNGRRVKYQLQNEAIKFKKLKQEPLVNIIIPAWNKSENFLKCLNYIKRLKYPKFRVIVNAGGSTQTMDIANKFNEDNNFLILHQKSGEGKIKAINDCLEHILEGLVLIIDADILLTDSILNKMIYGILNCPENVISTRLSPYKSILGNSLVKYIHVNRYVSFNQGIERYVNSVGANFLLKYTIIEKIKKFPEYISSDDGILMGTTLLNYGFKIFFLYEVEAQTEYPQNIRNYFNQNLRWIENNIFAQYRESIGRIMKFIILVILSFYILVCWLFLLIDIYLFLIGIILYFNFYLKRLRKVTYYKLFIGNGSMSFGIKFYIYMLFFVLLDLFMNIFATFELLFYRKGYKKRKNLK